MTRRIMLWFAVAIGLAAAMVVTNQILQLADLAARVNPALGQPVFWALVGVLGFVTAVPIVLVMRLPPPLIPPETSEGPEFDEHLVRLRRRLAANPNLRGEPMASRADVDAALARLDGLATERIKTAASRAFFTTAISQNGALDALAVLGIQARLTWDVAKVYSQRPRARELTYLYANVVTTAFLSGEIDDADVAEAMQPALSAVFGSAAGLVPGLQVAANIFVNSVLSGTANAFLTLRVGIIAREQSRALTQLPRRTLRRTALVQASALLGGIAVAGASRLSSVLFAGAWSSAGRAVKGAVTGTGQAVTGAVTETSRRIASAGAAVRGRMQVRGEPEAGGGSVGPV